MDSDDWLDLKALEIMYNIAKRDNNDIVICNMDDYYPNKMVDRHNCTNFESVFTVTASACNKIFKRKFVKDMKFISNIWYEDFNFTTKLLLNTKNIGTTNDFLYHCNCRETSTMNNNNSLKNLDMITAMNDIIKYAKEINKYDEEVIYYLIFDHILITSINRVAIQKNSDRNKVLKVFQKYCQENIFDYRNKKFYKKISKNRKIIAWLNYHGLWNISKLILKLKSIIK